MKEERRDEGKDGDDSGLSLWRSIYRRRLQEAHNTSPRDEANLEITKFGNKNITNGEEGRGSHMGYHFIDEMMVIGKKRLMSSRLRNGRRRIR